MNTEEMARELVRDILKAVALSSMPNGNPILVAQSALTAAYKRGQENMRERAATLSDAELTYFGTAIRALPIEGE